MKRGQDPEGEATEERERQREHGAAPVEAVVEGDREGRGGDLVDVDEAEPPARQQDSSQPAEEEDHHGLGRQAANQARAAGAQGHPDRELLLPGRCPRQQHAADVGASGGHDQEHEEGDQAEARGEGASALRRREARPRGADASVLVRFGVLASQASEDGGELGVELLDRDPVVHACHDVAPAVRARAEEPLRLVPRGLVLGEGHVEGGLDAELVAAEALGGDAHDRVGLAIQAQGPAEDLGRAREAVPPGGMAEDGDRMLPRAAVLRPGEGPALDQLDTEGLEVAGGHVHGEKALAGGAVRVAHRAELEQGRVREGLDLIAEVDEVRVAPRGRAARPGGAVDLHDSRRLVDSGNRPQKQGIDDGEEEGARAQADGQRRQCDEQEAGLPKRGAQREPCLLRPPVPERGVVAGCRWPPVPCPLEQTVVGELQRNPPRADGAVEPAPLSRLLDLAP